MIERRLNICKKIWRREGDYFVTSSHKKSASPLFLAPRIEPGFSSTTQKESVATPLRGIKTDSPGGVHHIRTLLFKPFKPHKA